MLMPAVSLSLAAQDSSGGDETTYISAVVDYEDDADLEELLEAGSVVFFTRDNMALMSIPESYFHTDSAVSLTGRRTLTARRNPRVRINPSQRLEPTLDLARQYGNIDYLHTYTNPRYPEIDGLTGEGVVVGMSDTGFDPHHIAFEGHVSQVWHFETDRARVLSATTPDQIAAWVTDTPDNYHATHVAGIMTGSEAAGQYVGVAPGADFVATTSALDDVGILCGVETIIARARELGRPAVVNLSLGQLSGPHDGTEAFTRYLDACARDAVVVMSAGNQGNGQYSIVADYTADRPQVRTLLQTLVDWAGITLYGPVKIWAADSRPVRMQVGVYDAVTKELVYTSPEFTSADADWYVDSDSDPEFARYYKGALAVHTEVDAVNSRWHGTLEVNALAQEFYPGQRWARHYIALVTSGDPGQHANILASGYNMFINMSNKDYTAGGAAQSISSIACGHNTIVVGSHTTRAKFTYPDGSVYNPGFPQDRASAYTSYGTTHDGRTLPHFAAPGTSLISAMSTPYVEAHSDGFKAADVTTGPDGKTYNWHLEYGTSMATPYAAGVFALWLQANPYLTGPEIRDLAISSATTDVPVPTDPRWGAGALNPVGGLNMVLASVTSCGPAVVDPVPVAVSVEGRRISVHTSPGAEIALCAASGARVDHRAELRPGVYILVVTSNAQTVTRKILIR